MKRLAKELYKIAPTFLLMLCLTVGGCRRGSPKTEAEPVSTTVVRVGYLPVSTTLPNWITMSEGLADKRGLDIEFIRYANSNLLLMGLLTGDIQATSVCADEPILAAASQGRTGFEIYLQEVLTTDRVFDAIVVPASSDLQDLSDLSGKVVACFPGTQLREYLRIILERAGVDHETVEIQQLPPPNMLPALQAGTIDACFALEPIITIGSARGLTRILAGSLISTYINDGRPICAASYLISTEWANEHPKAADAFVQAVYESVELISSDYDRVAALYPEFTGIPEELAPDVVITHFATIENPDLSGLEIEIGILKEAGVLEGSVHPKSLIYRWRIDQ